MIKGRLEQTVMNDKSPAMTDGFSLNLLNLNLLPVLRALLREPNLSRAAEALGVTQPSVSGALARLRIALDDPILVKVGRKMELTSRAHGLIKPVEEACAAIERIWRKEAFVPELVRRNFVIATTDYGAVMVAPRLSRELQAVAPLVSLQFVDIPERAYSEFHASEIDFFLLPGQMLETSIFSKLNHARLFEDEWVSAVGPNHCFASRRPTQEEYATARFTVYNLGLEPWTTPIGLMTSSFQRGHIASTKSHYFSLLPLMAMAADTVAILPRRIIDVCPSYANLVILEEFNLHSRFELCAAWPPFLDSDPVHHWFRDLFCRALATP